MLKWIKMSNSLKYFQCANTIQTRQSEIISMWDCFGCIKPKLTTSTVCIDNGIVKIKKHVINRQIMRFIDFTIT